MSHHVIIAGTGRAGTSFLVQYLAACGLETHLAANPDDKLDENANAGLEDTPIAGHALPYIVKSPWLFEVVDDLMARTDITLDAVIMPMRDIVEAATSRVILEMRARYGNENVDPQVAQWETWGQTPGGIVYSLNPIDQARILALGFHETVRALVKKDVPMIFLDFPRLVEEGDYLWSKLEPILQTRINRQDANAVHSRIADSGKVRAGKEIGEAAKQQAQSGQPEKLSKSQVSFPSHETLDRAALLRELTRLRGEVKARSADAVHWQGQAEQASALADRLSAEKEGLRSQLEQTIREAADAQARAEADLKAHQEAARMHASELEQQLQQDYEQRTRDERTEASARIAALEHSIAHLRDSTSWRVTEPIRVIARRVRGRS
ncbi:hypothetical protein ACTJLC_25390 [Paraburkholderia sp. 22099]|jgi:hypothetical protein|uniref:hypothetical protein n=1 Tax=Paraburkholderia TaxID=1822464 RepID=UPI0009F310E7|nr:hypothetical protein [Paraburkholderia terricola]MDR6445017.1 hypothetical protein [Paraburkholderia terricola]MDR6492228.1 hypothetical protein [Paraburkholderia terricola]ORC46628.1 hypothetical protein B2G74_26135 [Burkholderia sp. A27]